MPYSGCLPYLVAKSSDTSNGTGGTEDITHNMGVVGE